MELVDSFNFSDADFRYEREGHLIDRMCRPIFGRGGRYSDSYAAVPTTAIPTTAPDSYLRAKSAPIPPIESEGISREEGRKGSQSTRYLH